MKKRVLFAFLLLQLGACREKASETKATDDDSILDTSSQVMHPKDTDGNNMLQATASWKGILKMNDIGFAEKIAATPGLTIVDFSAEWCGPCKKLHPILESLATQMEGKVNFINVDVDESPRIASALQISSIPLLVFYKDGKIVDKTIGLLPEEELKAKISEHL